VSFPCIIRRPVVCVLCRIAVLGECQLAPTLSMNAFFRLLSALLELMQPEQLVGECIFWKCLTALVSQILLRDSSALHGSSGRTSEFLSMWSWGVGWFRNGILLLCAIFNDWQPLQTFWLGWNLNPCVLQPPVSTLHYVSGLDGKTRLALTPDRVHVDSALVIKCAGPLTTSACIESQRPRICSDREAKTLRSWRGGVACIFRLPSYFVSFL